MCAPKIGYKVGGRVCELAYSLGTRFDQATAIQCQTWMIDRGVKDKTLGKSHSGLLQLLKILGPKISTRDLIQYPFNFVVR